MKYAYLALSTLILCNSASTAGETAAPMNENDKINYSLGFELGQDLKRENLKLVPEALLRGAEDAMSGGKPLVKPTQRAAVLKQIKQKRAQANLEQAVVHLEKAIALDESYTPAHAQLAIAYALLSDSPGAYGDLSLEFV